MSGTSIKFTSSELSQTEEKTSFSLPENSCDSHHHIFNRRFPYTPEDTRNLPDATFEDYIRFKNYLGVTRHILVQPSSYGVDNACLSEALKLGGNHCRGEAVIDETFSEQQLLELAEQGVVGIRFNFGAGNYADAGSLLKLANRVLEYNWHIQIHGHADTLSELYPVLNKIRNRIVFDHYARLPQPNPFTHPFWRQLLNLIDTDRCWIKLSGPYHTSLRNDFSDIKQITQKLVSLAPERLLWGSDWPHPNLISARKKMPDDKYFLSILYSWLETEANRVKVFVDNPNELFFK